MSKHTVIRSEEKIDPQADGAVTLGRRGATRQHTFYNIGLITSREYKNRVAQRSFMISTIIILVLLAIGTCIPTIIQYFSSRSSSPLQLNIINNAGTIGALDDSTLEHSIAATLNSNQNSASPTNGQTAPQQGHFVVLMSNQSDAAQLQNAVTNNSGPNMLLEINRAANKNLSFTLYSNSSSDSDLAQLENVARQLNVQDQAARLGLTPDQTQNLFAQPDYKLINTTQDKRSAGEQIAGYFLAYIGIILIFMAIVMYGVGVANGVAEEKGSRIMEILVNAATPFQLMIGKIIGIGAAGLTQMLLLVIVGITGFLAQPLLQGALGLPVSSTTSVNITGASITLLLLVLLYFILGFLLYSTLFAAVGALVKRQEEVQSAAQPITWIFMVGYLTSFVGVSAPNALWVRIVSYVPFWSPTVMLMRMGAGSVAPWEVGLTVVLMLIAAFVCAIISARIYRSGILMYGQKPGLKQIISLARAK